MREDVNLHRHFEACFHFSASKCMLTYVRLPWGRSNFVTFMKVYRGYASGGEGLETTVCFFIKSTFYVNH